MPSGTTTPSRGGSFLVAYQGRLFSIQSDYQVCETNRGFHAIGCGADYALGSLASTAGQPAEQRAPPVAGMRRVAERRRARSLPDRAPGCGGENLTLPLLSAVA